MQPFEIIYVDNSVVACNGGGGALGHPKVYLYLSAEGKIDCPYCSRLFVDQAKRGQVDVTQPTSAEAPPATAQHK